MARSRQSLFLPILMGVVAILFTIAILVGWSVLFTNYYALYTTTQQISDLGAGYWILLAVGCLFLVMTVTTLVLLLVDNVRQKLRARQQDTFLDSVTHELKSPLAAIRLSLETLELRPVEPELQKRFLGMMKEDVDRLQAFIEHILEASRLELDRRELREEPVDLERAIRRNVKAVVDRYRLPEGSITVDIESAARPPTAAEGSAPASAADQAPGPSFATPVVIDEVALDTILGNLLDNAIKYSDGPARVALTARLAGSMLEITVRDWGIGISRRALRRIFGRFYRIRRPGRNVRGTGLGLYVVDALVRRLGGRVQAESEGEGKGTLFSVRMPVRAATGKPERSDHAEEAAVAARG